jgi:hypothetical protein
VLVRAGHQTFGRIARAAAVGVLVCLATGACSAGGPGTKKTDSSSPTAAPSAVALCHRTLTPADLPAGIPTTRGAAPDCSDPNNGTVGYVGTQTLAAVYEDLTLKPNAAKAATAFGDYVQSESLVLLNSVESNATPYRDLGDQVTYYYGNVEDTYWNYLFLRRGPLLMTVGITSYGATTPAQIRALVLKAISRYDNPGQTI